MYKPGREKELIVVSAFSLHCPPGGKALAGSVMLNLELLC